MVWASCFQILNFTESEIKRKTNAEIGPTFSVFPVGRENDKQNKILFTKLLFHEREAIKHQKVVYSLVLGESILKQ